MLVFLSVGVLVLFEDVEFLCLVVFRFVVCIQECLFSVQVGYTQASICYRIITLVEDFPSDRRF